MEMNKMTTSTNGNENILLYNYIGEMEMIKNEVNQFRKIVGSQSFKSGPYKGQTFDQLMKNKDIREKIEKSKSPAYRGINEYYFYLKQQAKKLNKVKRQQVKIQQQQEQQRQLSRNNMNIVLNELVERRQQQEQEQRDIINQSLVINTSTTSAFNGQTLRVNLSLLPIEIDIANEVELLINSAKISDAMNEYLQTNSDYNGVSIHIVKNNKVKFITLDLNEIKNSQYEETMNRIATTIMNFVNEYGDDIGDDNAYRFHTADVFVIDQNRRGGCNEGKEHHESIEINNIHQIAGIGGNFNNCRFMYDVIDHKSTNNNCGILCLIKSAGLNGNKFKPDSIRKSYLLPPNTPLTPEQLNHIAINFNLNLTVVNSSGFILFHSGSGLDKKCLLLLEDGHYRSIKTDNIKIKSICEHCGQHINLNNEHVCNVDKEEYYKTQIKKTEKTMITRQHKKCNKINYLTDVLFFDFETVQATSIFEVYAVGVIDNGEYFKLYGKNAMRDFVDYLAHNVTNKYLVAYNGGKFDFVLLLKELVNNSGIQVNNYLKNGSRMLGYEFNGNKIFDLINFTSCSLAAACDSFHISKDNKKLDFDHSLINTWEDVEKYEFEILPYLQNDLTSMRELFIMINDVFYESEGINITSFPTLSAMAFACLSNSIHDLKKQHKFIIELPDKEKDDYIRRSIYGGRVTAAKKEFINKQYENALTDVLKSKRMTMEQYINKCSEGGKKHIDKLISKKINYNDILNSQDYSFNADCISLYPTSMAGNDLFNVEFPVGFSRWSNTPSLQFKYNFMGFYEIDYIPPTDIMFPILPTRLPNGGIQWNLLPGSGVYTSTDIKSAIENGYSITFKGRCLVYDDSRNDIFKSYISKWFSIKQEQDNLPENERNAALREMSKLMMNSVYGKLLQRPVFESEIIANNIQEAYYFLSDKKFLQLEILNENKIWIKAECIEKDDQINKPSQLGAFVLAESRNIMLYYHKQISPDLKKITFSYGDTDSAKITALDHIKLKNMGLIPESNKLGYLSNDYKKGGVVIYEKNLGAKLYMNKYINKDNEIITCMKAKGLPKKYLSQQLFLNEYGRVNIKNSFAKVFIKPTRKEQDNNIESFTIRKVDIKRSFNETLWSGRQLINNVYYPIGYSN